MLSDTKLSFGKHALSLWTLLNAAFWVAMTLLIHFSGGIESPVILFFVFHIIIASIFFTPRTALAFALLAIALLSGTALLEFFGLLPHEAVAGFLPASLVNNGRYVAAVRLFFAGTGLIAAYLASSIQERLRRAPWSRHYDHWSNIAQLSRERLRKYRLASLFALLPFCAWSKYNCFESAS